MAKKTIVPPIKPDKEDKKKKKEIPVPMDKKKKGCGEKKEGCKTTKPAPATKPTKEDMKKKMAELRKMKKK
jgi:hypothetical protein